MAARWRALDTTGSCAITASPVNTMLYMGLIGWLLSEIFGSQKA